MPLVILAIGIAVLFVLIVGFRINSFLSLILVSLAIGKAEGLPFPKVLQSIEAGVGSTLGHLAIVVTFGAILGTWMIDSGGAQRIASVLISKVGRTQLRWAICLTGFIVGIALFYEVGFVLLIPLVFTIAVGAGISLLEVGIPMAAALSVTHCFLPPHPGPTAISVIYGADIGRTLIYGFIIAIPATVIAGPLFYSLVKNIRPAVPEGLVTAKTFSEAEMPGFFTSVLTALTPVILMAAASIASFTLPADSDIRNFFAFVGNADMALLIAVGVAFYTFGIARGIHTQTLMNGVHKAVGTVAMILLVIGGGGAFKQVLIDSGVGKYIEGLMVGSAMSPLVLAWLTACLLRVAVGSATVSALTTGGMMLPLIASTGVSPELMVLATGAGSVFAGPPNDPGFWMFKEFFNMTVKDTVKTWSVLETIISVVGLGGVLALNALLY
ncbi:gluconate:H+ symporter [Cupriavidus pinatubonensis]|uniref:Gnt-II system L-idonate transporter n=1 Tax=Cupriavidus pinatubonensis TaxID=248026 RepID=A0ABM8XSP9_9BURK|nr:gluconate:H+ symporter [Cupriavidus pinatubonensis]CAG9183348.1 Gnt-II system L-idonate transporter [Cupriavidus pinatubonensis]